MAMKQGQEGEVLQNGIDRKLDLLV